MRSHTSPLSPRRARRQAERRTRRRPVLVVGALALGAVCAVGITGTAAAPGAAATAPAGPTATFALASYGVATEVVSAADPAETEAANAAAAADASVQAAASVQADIAASGLDIGQPDTTVDTAALEAAADRLDAAELLPAPLVPALTDDVTELVASVDNRVAELRGSLEGAIQKKAEEEAAEKARQEAEAAAAAAAQAARASGGGGSGPLPAVPAGTGDNSPAGAQATARGMVAARGWGDDQFSCLVSLWNKESGWRVNAANPSGAYGIPQALPGSKMSSAGADWQTSAATQISWGLGYISSRYGTPCGAWQQSQSVGWY